MGQFRRGEQIAYVPSHVQQLNLKWNQTAIHPDVEFGFVTSQKGNTVFCRYWRKGHPGELRTLANSEGTPVDCLVRCKSVDDKSVRRILERIQ